MERRLPIFFLLDSSESMIGEPLAGLNEGLKQFKNILMGDPQALETVFVSVITFSSKAQQVVPLTEIIKFTPPTLSVGSGTSLGAGLDLLTTCLKNDVRVSTSEQKGDWKPVVILLTDGSPTDEWREPLKRLRALPGGMGNIIAIGCGSDVDLEVLREISPSAVLMKSLDQSAMRAFFKWVSASVSTVSKNVLQSGPGKELPPLPADTFHGLGISKSRQEVFPSQIILASRCSKSNKGYLMRYQLDLAKEKVYKPEKCYPVTEDYFGDSIQCPAGQNYNSKMFKGAAPCPYCGNAGWTVSKDKKSIVCNNNLMVNGGESQIMFVLDITGSMGFAIEGIKENIKDFVDYISCEGLDAECGLVAFRDLEMYEPHEVLDFGGGKKFTRDPGKFKNLVSKLSANGGGSNLGESSLSALVLACREFSNGDVQRIIVLITDEPPLIPDGEVRDFSDVTKAFRDKEIGYLYLVLPENLKDIYEPLRGNLKGKNLLLDSPGLLGLLGLNRAYKCNFREILLAIGKDIAVAARLG